MKIPSLPKLLEQQLKDLMSAEQQLVRALPKAAKKAGSPGLREAINAHLEETKQHVQRLEKIAGIMGIKVTGKKCKAMEGLIDEVAEALEAEGPESIVDCAIIAGAQRVEHYEISGYGTARTLAEQLGEDQVAQLLQQTLDEESAADEILTEIAGSCLASLEDEQIDAEADMNRFASARANSRGSEARR